MDHVVTKKASIVRVYFPPDVNTLLWVTDHCLRSWDRINVIVAGKAPARRNGSDIDAAITHCDRRASASGHGPAATIVSVDGGQHGMCEPDVVMACAGDVPTLETLAAVDLLHRQLVPNVEGPRGQRRGSS